MQSEVQIKNLVEKAPQQQGVRGQVLLQDSYLPNRAAVKECYGTSRARQEERAESRELAMP